MIALPAAQDTSSPDEQNTAVVDGAVEDVSTETSDGAKSQRAQVDWDAARDLYETHGLSMREIAARIGVSPNTVSVHARRDGWERSDETVKQLDSKRRANAQAAVEANRAAWAQRREAEADDAAASAKIARLGAIDAISERDWHLVRACSIAYGIFIDKAQLLTGGATSRTDVSSDDQVARSRSRRNELADRRARLAS